MLQDNTRPDERRRMRRAMLLLGVLVAATFIGFICASLQ